MTKPGHIEIGKELRFVYYESEKPESKCGCMTCSVRYREAFIKYEASKRSVEVSNVKKIKWLCFFYFGNTVVMHPDYELKHNQKCEAEITGETVTITKIL